MYNRENLKRQAEFYRDRYIDGEVSIELARDMIMPYINMLTLEREKLSKAYGRYLPSVTFEKFMKDT